MGEQLSYSPEQLRTFNGDVDNMYGFSGGLGPHYHAVADFAEGRELSENATEGLIHTSSNLFMDPYVWVWAQIGYYADPSHADDLGPKTTCPLSHKHTTLIRATHDDYEKLESAALRLTIVGGGEHIGPLDTPITPEQAPYYLKRAHERKIIENQNVVVDEPIGTIWQLLEASVRQGVRFDANFIKVAETITLETLRDKALTAAVHKLASMLAIVDQITWEARADGIPIDPRLQPDDPDGAWHASWERHFGEPMPGLADLYRQAHRVFRQHADPNDPLVAHLLSLTELPQLKD